MSTQHAILTGKEKACKLCGKVLKHQGALNIHLYHCKIKHGKHENVQKHHEEECAGGHNWRLLTSHQPLERQAIAQGYTEICIKCQEVQR